jgi:nucleoside-diphosphate-sugar epimerase
MKTELHVIFGTGPLGRAVMESALVQGFNVRMVNRSGTMTAPASVEVVSADVLHNRGVVEAMTGADCVYQCVNPAYNRWPEEFPSLQSNILNAAMKHDLRVVIAENVYMYGDTQGAPLSEALPYNATTRKGAVRAQMSIDAMKAHNEGKVKVVIGRASDFFGPHVLNSMLGDRQIGFALRGKKASLIGAIDVPHTFSYIKDFGAALVNLSTHDDCFGSAWHVPNDAPRTQREVIHQVFSELQQPVSFGVMGKTMLRIGGLFIPEARESVEMMYEFEQPFIVDSSKYEKRFGIFATPFTAALQETIQWYRQHRVL